jgi:hypothetical protein
MTDHTMTDDPWTGPPGPYSFPDPLCGIQPGELPDDDTMTTWRAVGGIPAPPEAIATDADDWDWNDRDDENSYSRLFDVRRWPIGNTHGIRVGARQFAIFDADWQRVERVEVRDWGIHVDISGEVTADQARRLADALRQAADTIARYGDG